MTKVSAAVFAEQSGMSEDDVVFLVKSGALDGNCNRLAGTLVASPQPAVNPAMVITLADACGYLTTTKPHVTPEYVALQQAVSARAAAAAAAVAGGATPGTPAAAPATAAGAVPVPRLVHVQGVPHVLVAQWTAWAQAQPAVLPSRVPALHYAVEQGMAVADVEFLVRERVLQGNVNKLAGCLVQSPQPIEACDGLVTLAAACAGLAHSRPWITREYVEQLMAEGASSGSGSGDGDGGAVAGAGAGAGAGRPLLRVVVAKGVQYVVRTLWEAWLDTVPVPRVELTSVRAAGLWTVSLGW